MAMFGNLKIGAITYFGVGLLAVAALSGAGTAYLAASSLGHELDQVANQSVPALDALTQLRGLSGDTRSLLASDIVSTNDAETRRLDQAFQDKLDALTQRLDVYRAHVPASDTVNIAAIEDLRERVKAWEDKARPVRDLSLGQHNTEAYAAFTRTLNPMAEDIGDRIATLASRNSKQAQADVARAVAHSHLLNRIALAVAAASLALAIGVGLVLHSRVTRALATLVAAMEDMAGGNLDRDVPGRDAPDEIGAVARALDAIKDMVAARAAKAGERRVAVQQQVVGSLGKGLAAMRDGRLDHRIDETFPEDYEQLRVDYNASAQSLASALAAVNRAAQGVQLGAGEIASASHDLSSRTENQAAALEESAAAVRQLSTTVAQTAQTAKEASDTARETSNEAQSSGNTMAHAVAAMEEISKSSQRMQEIVALIEGIAFQTNLLALNAGVEAARAGDAGRGFAVVASEVRSLAQRSSDAAKEITAIIQTSGRDVGNGVRMIGDTQGALGQIVERTSRLSGMIETIARSAEEQAAAIRQVDSVVSDMDRITQANAALVEEATAASRSLSNEANALGGLVGKFAVGNAAALDAAGGLSRLAA